MTHEQMLRAMAIPTMYDHCLFRSRLEARWAVFLNSMEIKWEYEPTGLRLESGLQYLPDFYLPKFKWFAEVKPNEETQKAERKAFVFCREIGLSALLLDGAPDFRSYVGIYRSFGEPFEAPFSLDIHNFVKATEESRLWSCPEYSKSVPHIYQFSERYIRAITAARSERFGS